MGIAKSTRRDTRLIRGAASRILLPGAICFLLLIRCAQGQSADAASSVPDPEAIAKATRIIKSTYRTQIAAAISPQQRIELAGRLLKEALDTKDDPAGKYVLLCEARDLASRAGEAPVARRAVLELAASFGIAPGEMMLQALTSAAQGTSSPAALEAVARCAIQSADEDLAREDYTSAAKLLAVAQGAATRSRRAYVASDVQEKLAEVTWAAKEHEDAKAALEAISLGQADAAGKSLAAKFKCLVKGEFDRGISLAAEGSDAQWQELAQLDRMASGGDAKAQARAADQWWEFSQNQPARARFHCRMRAASWYRRAMSGLAGLTKSTAEQRIDEFDLALQRRANLQAGLVAEIFAGEKFEKFLVRRVDSQIDFEWPGAPGEGLPKDDFSIRWGGKLRVPVAGRYTFTLLANEGARVWIDDKFALDLPEGTRKRTGKKEILNLTEGLHDLRIEFWDAGGLARVRLLWSTPTSPTEEPIPAKFFVHEPVSGEMGKGK